MTAPTNPATTAPGPRKRSLRTLVQVAVGVLLGFPVAIAGLGLPADVTAKVAAVTGTLAALASLVQNQWDKAHGNG